MRRPGRHSGGETRTTAGSISVMGERDRMDCERWSRDLRQWLLERWKDDCPPAEPPGALRDHAATCPECARRLRAALLLLDGAGLGAPAPPGLQARVVSRLRLDVPRRGWAPAGGRAPARVLVPVAAALIAALTAFVALRTWPPEPATVRVLLVLEAPQASRVSAVGDWNAWDSQANPLSDPEGDGVWTVEIQVRRGAELRYQFLIDGQEWIPDPRVPFQVDDGFGGTASILQT